MKHPFHEEESKTPEFAIFQNDNRKVTSVWVKEKGHWTDLPQEDFEVIQTLATLIRVTPDPSEVIAQLKIQTTGLQ